MHKPIRLLYLINTFGSGGAEVNLARLARRFAESPDFDVRIGCLRAEGAGASIVKATGARWFELGGGRPVSRFSAGLYWRGLRAHMKSFRPHIVHSFLMPMDFLGAFCAKRSGVPLIVSAKRSVIPWEGNALWFKLDRLACRTCADLIVCNSPIVRDRMAGHGFPPEKMEVVDNGIPQRALMRPERDPSEKFKVGSLGRLREHKGYGTLVEAMSTEPLRSEARLVIGGEGPDGPRLEALAKEKGVDLTLAGHVDNVDAFFEQIDVFALPSTFEGFSNVLLEAMNAACCCVASDIPENRHLLEEGGSGRFFPVQDAERLAEILSELLNDVEQRKRLGAEARNTVEERFSLDKMLSETERLYMKGLANKGLI